jgi:hypothetical protein
MRPGTPGHNGNEAGQAHSLTAALQKASAFLHPVKQDWSEVRKSEARTPGKDARNSVSSCETATGTGSDGYAMLHAPEAVQFLHASLLPALSFLTCSLSTKPVRVCVRSTWCLVFHNSASCLHDPQSLALL